MHPGTFMRAVALAAVAAGAGGATPLALADETCDSPYITGLIKGQEDFLYVWTLGVAGMGDGSDKLVTLDVNPESKKFGQVVAQLSVGARGEAHHAGLPTTGVPCGPAASTTARVTCSISTPIRPGRSG